MGVPSRSRPTSPRRASPRRREPGKGLGADRQGKPSRHQVPSANPDWRCVGSRSAVVIGTSAPISRVKRGGGVGGYIWWARRTSPLLYEGRVQLTCGLENANRSFLGYSTRTRRCDSVVVPVQVPPQKSRALAAAARLTEQLGMEVRMRSRQKPNKKRTYVPWAVLRIGCGWATRVVPETPSGDVIVMVDLFE